MADIVAISNAAADAAGIPRLLLLACGRAEGSLNPLARRPTSAADDERYWPDVSGGAWQQTVRWDPDYHGGADYPGPDEVARVLALQFDPERSARVAAANLAPKWRQYQPDMLATLSAYNWPAGGGKPKNAAVAANYRRGISEAEALLGDHGIPEHEDTGGNPDAGVPVMAVTYETYTDPQPAGTFASMPKGCIMHGSRSGVTGNPKAKEYTGTAGYEVNNNQDLGWNATIGENVVAVHLTPQQWGWNARAASSKYLGVEFAQATVDEPITDAQVAAFADWWVTRVMPAWPGIPQRFPSHAEIDGTADYGPYVDGKTDAFPKNDPRMEDLVSRVMRAIEALTTSQPNQQPVLAPASLYAVGGGILAAMQAHGDAAATDEMYTKQGDKDEWSEAMGASGSIYRYVFATGAVHRYDPAA
jgi:hypothetical protein